MNAFRTPTFWIGMVAALALVAGVALMLMRSSPPSPSALPSPDAASDPASTDTTGDGVIRQALDLTPENDKDRWVDEVQGTDVSGLDPARLELFVRFANARACTCGCGYTLAGCRSYDPTCETSPPILAALRDSIRAGLVTSARGIRSRPGRAGDGY